MKFIEGEEILAKPPNSDDYQKGKILSVKNNRYRIKFESGTEMVMLEDHLQAERPSRTSVRTRSRGRKSPSRKSPSRQSPSRKSPSRRSPARSPTTKLRKQPVRKMPDDKDDDNQSSSVSLSETDQLSDLVPLQVRMKDLAMPTRRSSRISQMKTERVISSRMNDRAVSLPVERKVDYDYIPENKERGFSVQRDQDLQKLLHYEEEALPDSSTANEKLKKDKEIELVSKPQEWGGWFGALCLTLILPISIILPQVACQNNNCSSAGFRLPLKWQAYFDLTATLYYLGFVLFVAIMSLIPIGKLVHGQQTKNGRLQYQMNGWITALVAMLGFCGLDRYSDDGASVYIMNSLLRLSVSAFIIGTLIAIGLYGKAGRAPVAALNIYGSTNNFIYDFWQGREVNPRIGKLDIKMVLVRCALIGGILINEAIVMDYIQKSPIDLTSWKDINLTLPVVIGLQIFYCADALWNEATSLTSFRVMYEGSGYMLCVANLLHPFLMSLVTRYVAYQNVEKSSYVLVALCFTYFTGYLIYRISNNLKNEFRQNPYSPTSTNMEAILTPRGKKLIVSGLWGQVRHPNYLGDIIMHWSIAGISLFTHEIIPYYPVLTLTLVLMHRAYRDHVRCKTRYGSAWTQYTSQVRALIFKRIY